MAGSHPPTNMWVESQCWYLEKKAKAAPTCESQFITACQTKRRKKTNVSVGAKSTGGGGMPPGIAGGGRKLTFSKIQHFALLYIFWLGTDLDLPLYGSPLNPITISFHDYTIIFSLSNGIKALEPPKRPFFLIHSQPNNSFFRPRTYLKFIFSQRNALLKNKKKMRPGPVASKQN